MKSSLRSAALLGPALLWLTLFFAAPFLLVVVASFCGWSNGQLSFEFSLEGWRRALDATSLRVLTSTLTFALGTMLACLALGLPMAWFIVKRSPRVRKVFYALVLIPMVANSLVLVYAWRNLLHEDGWIGHWLVQWHVGPEGNGIYGTGWASLIGLVYYYLPFMIYPIYTSLEKMDWRLMEAAADLGARPHQSFFSVILPLIWPGLGTGCVLVFIQVMGTFVIPDILFGNKGMLLGTLINSKFLGTGNHWPEGAAISLMGMCLIAFGLLIYFRLQDKIERQS